MTIRYRFVPLSAGRTEIWHGDRRYFLLSTPDAPPRIVPGACPHRGGPLALGHYDASQRSWRCPWHGTGQQVPALCRRALPAIRRGVDWLVALPVDAGLNNAGLNNAGPNDAGPNDAVVGRDPDPICLTRST